MIYRSEEMKPQDFYQKILRIGKREMLFHDWLATAEPESGATAKYAPKNQNLRWRLPLLAARRRRRLHMMMVRATYPTHLSVAKPLFRYHKTKTRLSARFYDRNNRVLDYPCEPNNLQLGNVRGCLEIEMKASSCIQYLIKYNLYQFGQYVNILSVMQKHRFVIMQKRRCKIYGRNR